MCSDVLQYAHDEDRVEYPLAHEFYCRSNTHNPDEDGFHDLYHWDFIHAISRVAQHKLLCHWLNPYQHAAFQRSIVCHNIREEKADPTLELAMEYAGALGTIVFNKLCRFCDLMEAQVGRNQFTVEVAVDRLDERIDEVDGRADHTLECFSWHWVRNKSRCPLDPAEHSLICPLWPSLSRGRSTSWRRGWTP